MRGLIVTALICAILGLFVGLATQMLAMAGQYNRAVYFVTGPITVICHGLPPILLSVVLLNRQDS